MNKKRDRIARPAAAVLMATLLSTAAALAQPVAPIAPGPGMQLHPALVSCNGLDDPSLVVWEDWRSPEAADIYGTRIVWGYVVLDSNAIPISTAARNQLKPAVARSLSPDSPFLVVWEDWRNGGPAIYGARVTDGGEVLDRDGFRISFGPNPAYRPAITTSQSDSSDYLVVWEDCDSDSTTRIAGSRISRDGLVRDSTPIVMSRLPGRQVHPACACNTHAASFLTVWEEHSPLDDSVLLYAARVDYAGRLLDTVPVRVCTTESRQTEPTVASDSAEYLVLWQDDRRDSAAIYAARLNAYLQCPNPSGTAIDSTQNIQRHPSVWWGWEEGWFSVCWEESSNQGWSAIQIGSVYTLYNSQFFSQATVTDSLSLVTPKCGGGPEFVAAGVPTALPGTPTICRWPEYYVGKNEHTSFPPTTLLRVEPSIARDRCRVAWQTNRLCSPSLQVLDVNGRIRREYRCGSLSPGRQQAYVDLAGLAPGAYFIRLVGVGSSVIRRIVVLR